MAWILEYQPTILLPGKGYSTLQPYLFQQEFIACRDDYRAINKPRQCGISTIVAAEVAWEFDNVPGAQIMIVSKDMAAAQNFHIYVMDILKSVRRNNPDAPRLTKENQSETRNVNGSRIVSLAAGKEAGRSFSPTHFVFDEAAFTIYADDIWQAASSGLAKTLGRATVISTPKGRGNWYHRIFEAQDHMGFTTFNYGWWDVPDYNPYYAETQAAESTTEKLKWIEKAKTGAWFRKIRPSKTELQWRQEFEGAFDANVGSVFSTRQLERVFCRNYLIKQEDPKGLFDDWWEIPKEDGHEYYSGIDLGRKNDPTEVFTYDISLTPAKLVCYKHVEAGRADWSMLEDALRDHLVEWDGDSRHDATGVGDVMSEALYGLSDPFYFTKTKKQDMIEIMQHAFDKGAVKIPKIPRVYRQHQRYLWDDKDIIQDTVMANGLAIGGFYESDEEYIGVSDISYVQSALG